MTNSVCVCCAHQNVMLLADAKDWDLTYKDLIVYKPESNKRIMYRCESCPGTATLKESLDQEVSEREDDQKFNNCQWNTTDRAILTTFPASYEKYKETLMLLMI